MALEMRGSCEKCGKALGPQSEAYICVFECTFCEPCALGMTAVCPNCGGELARRPRARTQAEESCAVETS